MLVWILVAAIAVGGWRLLRSPLAKETWYRIFYAKTAMASSIVLLFYLGFALLDSVHFKQVDPSKGSSIVSLLDMAMSHQRTVSERTYSAPFATHEYVMSVMSDPKSGKPVQQYLPLKHVKDGNIWEESIIGMGAGLLLALGFVMLHIRWRGRKVWRSYARDVWFGKSSLPWRTAYMVLTTLITLPLAVLLGVAAGYFRGWVDDLIQYLYMTLSSIPGVLLIAAGVLMMQVVMDSHPEWFASTIERSDLRLLFLVVILGVTSWTGLCRMLRAETLRIAKMDYVIAAKAFGVSRWRIMLRHIVPNLTHIILISIVLDFSGLVLAEAVLSYVGVGVDPTMYSWGNMINQARLEMAREPMVWWSLAASFVFMFLLVLAANLLSDRVQQVLDPRSAG